MSKINIPKFSEQTVQFDINKELVLHDF